MADKQTQLSIILRAIDQATGPIKAVNAQLAKVTKPIRDFKKSLGELAEKSGLNDVVDGFKGVGSAIGDLLGKVALVGGVVGVAVAGLVGLVDQFDDLGKKAALLGVGVDFLASMRYAAEKTGVPVEKLDSALQAFNENLGAARAGTGRMAKFVGQVSPVLLTQLKAAKDNAAAFDLLAGAFAKVTDPAKRAALAQKTLGDSALAPLFAKGPKAIKELRDAYLKIAGSQEDATKEASDAKESMVDLKAATDGVKAALVTGLAPALKIIVERIKEFVVGHREDIKEWAVELGKRLPGAFSALVDAVRGAIDFLAPFFDSSTKIKVALVALGAVIAGPLISAVVSFGIALLSTPVGWILAGLAALSFAAYKLITDWDGTTKFFTDLWDTLKDKFGIATDIVASIIAPFIYIPAKIIANWGAIKDFFAGLWDGVKAAFEKAWEAISEIVRKIVDAANTIKTAIKDAVTGGPSGALTVTPEQEDAFQRERARRNGDVSAQASAAVGASGGAAAKVTVDFANAPRGTRVTADPKGTADVDLSVGYQLIPGGV